MKMSHTALTLLLTAEAGGEAHAIARVTEPGLLRAAAQSAVRQKMSRAEALATTNPVAAGHARREANSLRDTLRGCGLYGEKS